MKAFSTMSSKLQAPNKQEMSLNIPAYTYNPIFIQSFILKNCIGYSLCIRPSNVLSAGIVVKLLSCVPLFVMPWTAAHQSPLSFTISQTLLRFMSTELVMLSNHLILCGSLLLLPSVFPSIRVFSSQLAFHIRWPKYWSFIVSISPPNEYSGFLLRLTGLVSLQSEGLSRVFHSTAIRKHKLFSSSTTI